jgi:DNA/RNA endonuclease YhcR with UshA esterase domain
MTFRTKYGKPAKILKSFLLMNGDGRRQIQTMKTLFSIFLILALALKLSADGTNNVPALKIGANDAAQHYGQEMTVTGTVAQVTIRPKVIYLNLDQPYPDSPFTLVIFPHDARKFGNLKELDGKNVEATGKIRNYHDRPEMILNTAKQLKIVEQAN